jgi:glycerol uptake facilitator-like aquaporin
VITANILIGGLLTGAAMNPARWFGPALAFGDLSAAAVYIVGPLIGAVVAALSVRYLFAER